MKAPVRRRDLLALGGLSVVAGLVFLVIVHIRAAGGKADGNTIASQWEGYISVVAAALLPLSWLVAWWSGARSPEAPPGPPEPANPAEPPKPPPKPPSGPPTGPPPRSLTGPPRRRPGRRLLLTAIAIAVLASGSVTALALRPAGSRRSAAQAAGPGPIATPTRPTPTITTTSPSPSPGQVTPTSPLPETGSSKPPPDQDQGDTTSTTRPPPTPPPPPRLTLTSPTAGATMQARTVIRGTSPRLGAGESLWLLLYTADIRRYYIESQDGPALPAADGSWQQEIGFNTKWPGGYVVYAVIVNARDGQALRAAVQASSDHSPYIYPLPSSVGARQSHVAVRCCN